MKVIIIGYGIQGKKREKIAGGECIATVDPDRKEATYRDVREVPLSDFDAALVCTPDPCKISIIEYLLNHKKHVLVEKPLFSYQPNDLEKLEALAKTNNTTCYTAYNHRFEPHFIRMKELIDKGVLGKIYHCRMFYGNGTARDVRNSVWKDKGAGVLPDLGSHLLDTILYWFGDQDYDFQLSRVNNFENQSPDHAVISNHRNLSIDLEMTFLSWRNHFTCDLFAENGSAHIESLCKWGPSRFTFRKRTLPSGRPQEEAVTLVQPDPTWQLEYDYFKKLCRSATSNLHNDLLIDRMLQTLTSKVLV